MKKSIFAVGLILVFTGLVYLQTATPAASSGQKQLTPAQKRLRYLTRQLNLSEVQQQQIGAILDKGEREMEAAKLNHGPRPQQRQERVNEIFQQTQERVKTQLTPEQQQEYQQIITGKWKDRPEASEVPTPAQPVSLEAASPAQH